MNIKTRPLQQAEFQTLIFSTPQPWKSIFMLAYCTAYRVSDLLSLKRTPCPKVVQLVEKKTKRQNVIVPHSQLIESWNYLYSYHDGEYLIPFRDPSTFRKSLVSWCKKCGIDTTRVAFHSIRKTTATTLYKNLGFIAASHFLNHAKLSTTLSYIEMDAVEVGSILESSFHLHGEKR